MICTLGSITLSDELVLRGLDADTIAVDTQRSDEGVMQLLVAPLESGRELSLHGYFTVAQEEAILALSAAGVAVTLTHDRFSGSVLIVGTELEDDFEHVNPGDDEQRVGVVNLIEV